MAFIRFLQRGDYEDTRKWLKKMGGSDSAMLGDLKAYGEEGVRALASATPVDSGLTADSWEYSIVTRGNGPSIEWHNTNVHDGVNVAIILQYGHGTGTGGYVAGRDYINPAIRPIFEKISSEVRKRVS